jgi:phosphoenolpyruvate carboxylase
LRPQENALDVNIVPLFETIDDLARSGAMQEVIASSRSASRKKTTAIENLRAIPRVFS